MYSRRMKRGARPLVSPAPRSWRGGIAAALVAWLLLVGMTAAGAAPRQVGEHRWEGVERIVAIGDVHGDYDNYMAALRLAGIVDRDGRWSAGAAHLVQTGDIADRGPDSRRIISHMKRLRRDARRQGGRVHHLLGNHEAMNVLGDLRYVSDGEYRAFVDRHSRALRERYYRAWLEALETGDPAAAGALAPDHRETWEREHPLGWVEHRLAWDPRWDPSGELFRWAMEAAVAVQINDLLFVHGGISARYCGNSLESLTAMARHALADADRQDGGILVDPAGPLWYRGLAGAAPATSGAVVDAILERHGAARIVIGHTPTPGVVWPRLDGRVVMIDTGLSGAYGGHIGWLEATPQGLWAGYPGGRLALPDQDGARPGYLDEVIALDPGNLALVQRRERLAAGLPDAADAAVEQPSGTGGGRRAARPGLRQRPLMSRANRSGSSNVS